MQITELMERRPETVQGQNDLDRRIQDIMRVKALSGILDMLALELCDE